MLQAEGWVSLMGKVGLPGGTGYYLEAIAWGGVERDLGKSSGEYSAKIRILG